MTILYESIDGKRGVRIERDGQSLSLSTMRNGYQWAGMPVDRDLLLSTHAAIESAFPEAFGDSSSEGAEKPTPEIMGALREAERGLHFAWQMLSAICDSDPSRDRIAARDRTMERLHVVQRALASCAPAASPWKPIALFDYEQQPRMRWIIAEDDHVIGECYWGVGPRYAGEHLNDEPEVKAWRYSAGGRRVPEHLKPTHFMPIPDAPSRSGKPAEPGWQMVPTKITSDMARALRDGLDVEASNEKLWTDMLTAAPAYPGVGGVDYDDHFAKGEQTVRVARGADGYPYLERVPSIGAVFLPWARDLIALGKWLHENGFSRVAAPAVPPEVTRLAQVALREAPPPVTDWQEAALKVCRAVAGPQESSGG